MPTSTPEAPTATTHDDTVVIEAPSAQKALEEVSSRLGAHAEIVNAERVLRGGIGGFFAREHVQLTVRAREAVAPAAADASSEATMTEGLDAILARLADDADSAEMSFSEALRRQLAVDDDVPAGGAPPDTAPAPQPTPPPAVADTSGVVWSVDNLRRLGLPTTVTAAVAAQHPTDDLSWLTSVAETVAPLCGALPEGPTLFVGPRAQRVARPLGLPTVPSRAEHVPAGSIGVRAGDGTAARGWLAAVRNGRSLHVVVGGDGWQRHLFDAPTALSWSAERDLGQAVALASALGLTLGYAADARGTRCRRATPVDIAYALRAQLPRS